MKNLLFNTKAETIKELFGKTEGKVRKSEVNNAIESCFADVDKDAMPKIFVELFESMSCLSSIEFEEVERISIDTKFVKNSVVYFLFCHYTDGRIQIFSIKEKNKEEYENIIKICKGIHDKHVSEGYFIY